MNAVPDAKYTALCGLYAAFRIRRSRRSRTGAYGASDRPHFPSDYISHTVLRQ
jgi:hypothetical protein